MLKIEINKYYRPLNTSVLYNYWLKNHNKYLNKTQYINKLLIYEKN